MSREMTTTELNEHIKDVVVPLINDAFSQTDIAEVVRERVAKLLDEEKAAPVDGTQQVRELLERAGGDAESPGGQRFENAIGCYIRALAAAKNNPSHAAEIARKWGRVDVADAIVASQEKALSAGDATAGGFLVPTEFSAEVIELLRASAVVRSLGPTILPMASGSIKVPRITSGSAAAYIGENVNIEKTELETGQLTLTFKKLASLVPISNDLIRYAAPSADAIVRNDLIRAMAAREDLAFIRDDGTSGKPKGLKNWIHSDNKFTANGTVNLANVTNDLGKMMQLLMDAQINLIIQQGGTGAIDVNPGWIFHPRQWKYLTTVQTGLGTYAFRDEMLRGTLWGFPYRVTTQCENTTVYFGAFAHAVIGESLGLVVDASAEAAYHDGNAVVAAYSQDQTVIRVIQEHDFALRHDKAFALAQTVTWGA